MLKVRKYLDGEVIETNLLGEQSEPITEDIGEIINHSLAKSKEKILLDTKNIPIDNHKYLLVMRNIA